MSYLPEFEVWRERQRELLREAEERRLAPAAKKVRGRNEVSVPLRESQRGLALGFAAMVRQWKGRFALRGTPGVIAGRDRRCEE